MYSIYMCIYAYKGAVCVSKKKNFSSKIVCLLFYKFFSLFMTCMSFTVYLLYTQKTGPLIITTVYRCLFFRSAFLVFHG